MLYFIKKIPISVTIIDYYNFSKYALEMIEIPSSVTSIGNYLFSDCIELKK